MHASQHKMQAADPLCNVFGKMSCKIHSAKVWHAFGCTASGRSSLSSGWSAPFLFQICIPSDSYENLICMFIMHLDTRATLVPRAYKVGLGFSNQKYLFCGLILQRCCRLFSWVFDAFWFSWLFLLRLLHKYPVQHEEAPQTLSK